MLSTRSFLAVAAITFLATAPAPASAQPLSTVHRFSAPLRAGFAPMVEAPDGKIYGVMDSGGKHDAGAIFVVTPDPSGLYTFSLLYEFNRLDGEAPNGLLYSAVDGLLYGTTSRGGVDSIGRYDGEGTIFSLTTSGTFRKLVDFDLDFETGEPLVPAGLFEASDGLFYGTSFRTATTLGSGSIFSMDREGAIEVLHRFSGADGDAPSVLVEGADGRLYGTTFFGGPSENGTIFRIEKDGSGFTTLHLFSGTDGSGPTGLLREPGAGGDVFYGTTSSGGASFGGIAFTITPAGAFTPLASFIFGTDVASPVGSLVKGPDGMFYGTSERFGQGLNGTVYTLSPSGTITLVQDFNTSGVAGFVPRAGLLRSASGLLYGITTFGGAHRTGRVFSVDTAAPAGTMVRDVVDVIPPGPTSPMDRLLRASDGALYGTSPFGGNFDNGTVFRFGGAGGGVTPLHHFQFFLDGWLPSGDLIEGSDGFLYGTTQRGGLIRFPGDGGEGSVFRISPGGSLFVVHRFDIGEEGTRPLAGLVEGPDGNFYGTTTNGGAGGVGTVFKMTPGGQTTTLHHFNGTDGWFPSRGSLVIGEDGFFYGVTREGGAVSTNGLAYKIDSGGNFFVLHEFDAATEGAHPQGLTLGTDGNFYGVTESGVGAAAFGTLFRMTPAGAVTVLHTFDRAVDGGQLNAEPIEAGDGNLYGTTVGGGQIGGVPTGFGTVYRYDGANVGVLHTFDFLNDGAAPYAGLVQGSDNRLYGMTSQPQGTIFALDAEVTNKKPAALHQRVTTGTDTPVDITVNVSDPDADPLTVLIVDPPDHGTLSGAGPAFTYTPDPGYTGPDAFRLGANDGVVSSGVATILITVTGGSGNTPPVAVNDAYSVSEDGVLTVAAPGVLANDTDADGNPLTAILVSGPAHGALTLNSDGSFIYTPAANYNGPDSFTYKANDGTADSNVATVSLTVNPVNDVPVAGNDSYSTNEDVALIVAAPGVLGNDTDGDGNPLTAILVSGPAHGTLIFNSNGSFTYTPAANSHGPDSFTYKANDGTADSNVATVSITVDAVNDAPVAVNDSYTTNQDMALTVAAPGLLANDTDADGNPLVALLVAGPSHGTVALNGNGAFTYTPGPGFTGSDGFTYKANDGTADSNVATVLIAVQPTTIATTTTLQASAATIGVLQPVTLVASVASVPPGTGVPGLTVEFLLGGTTLLGTAPLAGGTASLTVNGLPIGPNSLTARYVAAGAFAGSVSAAVTVTVQALAASSFTVVIPPATPQLLGAPVTANAIVFRLGGGAAPTGTVEFYEGTMLVGTGTLSSGVATVTWTPVVGIGVRLIWARYLGSASFAPSTSPPALFSLYFGAVPATTTTTLAASPNPSTIGQPVTFTATVSNPVPVGSLVAFFADGVVLGTAPVTIVGGARQAILTTSTLPAFVHVASASYLSAPGFAASNSNLRLHVVNP